jgi:uncharacterized protein YaaN involved in tellurite resistance
MSVGVQSRRVAAPPADAARVAAIRNKLDVRNASDVAGFGEKARKEVLGAIERLLAEVRVNAAGDLGDRLASARDRIQALEPGELEPRGGLDNLFNGRTARLHRFRRAFEGAAQGLQALAGELEARGQKVERQIEALNGLHEQARAFIL